MYPKYNTRFTVAPRPIFGREQRVCMLGAASAKCRERPGATALQCFTFKACTRMRSFISPTNSSQVTALAFLQQASKYSTYLLVVSSSMGKHTDHSWFARLDTVKFALPIIAILPTLMLLACWIPTSLLNLSCVPASAYIGVGNRPVESCTSIPALSN